MLLVSHLLDVKGHTVHTVKPDDSVFSALERLAEYNVGALLVMEGDKIAGILSERDYARKVILMKRYSADTPVSDVMTQVLTTVSPSDTVDHCMQLCTRHHVRHLPVVENDRLVGMISIGDLVKALLDAQAQEIQHLHDYIAG